MSLIDKLASIKQYRDEIREAIEAKGGNLPEGSPMSDYAGAINEISGGEIDYSKVNGFVKELELRNGVLGLKDIGGNTLVLPQEPHEIGNNFLSQNKSITTLVNTEYITKIGNSTFNSSNISGEYDFSNVTELGYDAFRSSNISGDLSFPKLTTLVSPGNYSGYHFYYTKITSIDMPLVENLPYQTFSTCYDLKVINIPNVKTIHYSAFPWVNNCETIILGETIPTISGGTGFNNFLTAFASPNCKIQVPPHMVDAYKEDTSWSQYADRIIPYPEEV